jgi:rare lipoprotein A
VCLHTYGYFIKTAADPIAVGLEENKEDDMRLSATKCISLCIATLCATIVIGASSLCLAQSQSAAPAPAQPATAPASEPVAKDTAVCSYYSSKFEGRRTASGERFSNNALTAAHREYPLGTKLRLTNVKNGKSVVVRVNDRGPFVKGRDISVTRRAAKELGFVGAGFTEVKIEKVTN